MNVNIKNPVQFIDELGNVVLHPIENDPNDKQYLILIINYDNDERTWEMIQGRISAYHFLKDAILDGDINPNESRIMTETHTFNESITVVEFLEFIFTKNIIPIEESYIFNDYIDLKI